MTTIIVAQRISSVKDADLIIVLDEGEIADMGTHEHLLSSCDIYREISESQMGGAFVE
jgi:ATP-binding cassette subfamily B protein